MDKFVDIKIRAKYRDMLKEYCKDNGYKMYACVESLIEKNCRKKKVLLRSCLKLHFNFNMFAYFFYKYMKHCHYIHAKPSNC